MEVIISSGMPTRDPMRPRRYLEAEGLGLPPTTVRFHAGGSST